MRTAMRAQVAVCVLGLVAQAVPSPARAQFRREMRLGGGLAWSQAAGNSGSASHVTLQSTLLPLRRGTALTVGALGQMGSSSGSPYECLLARPLYCVGRSERLTVGGLSVGIETNTNPSTSTRLYTRTQVGAYMQRVHASELEGPTALCVVDQQLVSCPSNPPVQRFRRTSTGIGPGAAYVGGATHKFWHTQVWVEVAVHAYWVDRRNTQLVYITAGVAR